MNCQMRLLLAIVLGCLYANVIAQTSERVKAIEVTTEQANKEEHHARWITEKNGKIVAVRVWSVVSSEISPFAVDTDEQDSYIWLKVTDKRQTTPKPHFFRVGPFFYPKTIIWSEDLTRKQDIPLVLLISYLTPEKHYGSLDIFPDAVKFTARKSWQGPVKINIPDR